MGKDLIKICSKKDVPNKKMRVFNIKDIEIVITNFNGVFSALYNKCPHMGGSLGDGTIDFKGYITCPLHGWQFGYKTGLAPEGYEDSVKSFILTDKNNVLYLNKQEIEEFAKDPKNHVKCEHNSKERFYRAHDDVEKDYDVIRIKAMWRAKSILPMRTLKKVINFDDVQFLAAQLSTLPLLHEEKVNLKTVIGKKAKKPITISMPVYISHMSFGALSEEAKVALAKGAAKNDIIMCSGEGGANKKESNAANKYIHEIGTACFTRRKEWIDRADAIEIKIGQAAKPGLGGHLPKEKITKEIAKLRGIPMNEDQISPARFPDINNKFELKKFVSDLRKQTKGKPIGIKFAAGHIEKDLEVALFAKPDFITIDGRGGGTGAAPVFIKDNFAVPIIYAISRARKYLDSHDKDVTLVATGGFRTAAEIAKALAMGADAVAIATAAMIAIGCQQYRACHTGNCPVGIATQKKDLRNRFSISESTNRLNNYLQELKFELTEIVQAIGKKDINKLNTGDLVTTNSEISNNTNIKHA